MQKTDQIGSLKEPKSVRMKRECSSFHVILIVVGEYILIKVRARCSKLTTSLVNVSLKFQTVISQICLYF